MGKTVSINNMKKDIVAAIAIIALLITAYFFYRHPFGAPVNANQINLITTLASEGSDQWIQGKTYEIKWTGGRSDITLSFTNQVVMDASIEKSPVIWSSKIPNTGNYRFTVPASFPAGGPYVFYLKDGLGNFGVSHFFSVKSQ
jgi:hypothetical protein